MKVEDDPGAPVAPCEPELTEVDRLRERMQKLTHDLRTPLHALGLACDALREVVGADGDRYLRAIDRAAARIENLIADPLT